MEQARIQDNGGPNDAIRCRKNLAMASQPWGKQRFGQEWRDIIPGRRWISHMRVNMPQER